MRLRHDDLVCLLSEPNYLIFLHRTLLSRKSESHLHFLQSVIRVTLAAYSRTFLEVFSI